jgi:hypothetical protein
MDSRVIEGLAERTIENVNVPQKASLSRSEGVIVAVELRWERGGLRRLEKTRRDFLQARAHRPPLIVPVLY